MSDLQKKLLEMLKWLTKYLDDNNISYYVVGGTLLGAVRHKGFIPWDDDIDIARPRPDYDKLIKLFNGVIDNYKLESPYENNKDYLYTYAKFYDVNTTLVERLRKKVKRGVFIDVFPLDGVGNTKEESVNFFKKVDKKNMFLMTRVCAIRKQRGFVKNAAIVVSRLNPFVNTKKYSLKVDKLASSKNYDDCNYVANLNGAYREREVFEKSFFGEPTNYQFEDMVVKGPAKYDEYLTQLYHDWTKLPPEEKRGVQHDFVLLDLDKPYLEK